MFQNVEWFRIKLWKCIHLILKLCRDKRVMILSTSILFRHSKPLRHFIGRRLQNWHERTCLKGKQLSDIFLCET